MTELDREDLPLPDQIDLGSISAIVSVWRGDPRAAAQFASLEARLPAPADPLSSAVLLTRRSMAALALGRPGDALTDAEATTPILQTTGLSTSLVENGGPDRARRAMGGRCRSARTSDRRDPRVRGARPLARHGGPTMTAGLEASLGTRRAADRYGTAAAAWRSLDAPLQLALCQIEAALLLPPGSAEAADAARRSASDPGRPRRHGPHRPARARARRAGPGRGAQPLTTAHGGPARAGRSTTAGPCSA